MLSEMLQQQRMKMSKNITSNQQQLQQQQQVLVASSSGSMSSALPQYRSTEAAVSNQEQVGEGVEQVASNDQKAGGGGEDVLPPGWQKIYSNKNNRFYWFNEATQVSQWYPPTR